MHSIIEVSHMPTPLSPKPAVPQPSDREASALNRSLRLFWLCLSVSPLAVAVLAWFFGLTWWMALVAALVIGCPVVVAWIVLGGFGR